MADIEMVIKIPDIFYTQTKSYVEKNEVEGNILFAVAHGTPLPKGHGRLIDENDLWFEDIDDISCITQRNVENAPTIIESDKGDKE